MRDLDGLAAMADAALDIHGGDTNAAGHSIAAWLTPAELAALAPALLADTGCM